MKVKTVGEHVHSYSPLYLRVVYHEYDETNKNGSQSFIMNMMKQINATKVAKEVCEGLHIAMKINFQR